MGLFGFIGKIFGGGGTKSSKIKISKVSASAGLPVIYGKRRVEPITVFKVVSRSNMTVSNTSAYDNVHKSNSSDASVQSKTNDFLHRIDVWGQGVITDIELFWLDGDAHSSARFASQQYFRGLTKYGTDDQAAAAELVAGHFDWTSEHQGKGVAYTWSRFYNLGKKEQFDGEPELEALVKGLKLYDPRADTSGYSNNRALAVLDYLRGSYGFSTDVADIDIESFETAADACDALMDIPARPRNTKPYAILNQWDWRQGRHVDIEANEFWEYYRPEQGADVTQPKYTVDAILDPKDGVVKNTKLLLEGMGWSLPWSNGKHKLIIEGVVDAPVMHFDEDSIIGGWNVERGMRADRLNRVTVEFPNANKEYKDDTVGWPAIEGADHLEYKAEDQGQDLHTNISVETITDFYRARAFAEYTVRKSRVGPKIKGLKLAPKAMLLEPGDVISIYYEDKGFGRETNPDTSQEYEGTLFIVERVDVSAFLDVRVDLLKYDPTVYGAPALDVEPIPNSPYNPDWWVEPPAIENLTLDASYETNADGTIIRGIDVNWDLPEGLGGIAAVEVEWKKSSEADYTSSMTLTADSTSAKISGLVNYIITFDVRVTFETQRGQKSTPAIQQITFKVVQSALDVLNDGLLVFADFWDFGSSEMGWTASQATIETPSSSDSNSIGFRTTGDNASMISPGGLTIDGSVWNQVIVRMKRLTASADNTDWEAAYLYYNTATRGGFDQKYREYSNARYVTGKYVTFVFDMAELSSNSLSASQKNDWITSTITQIRFDPTITEGDNLAIDWIGVGRVAPSVTSVHAGNLVSDLGFKKFAATDVSSEENFTAKTLDAMNLRVGDHVSAAIEVEALGADPGGRRGRLKLEFLDDNFDIVSEEFSSWSTVFGEYAPVSIIGALIKPGTVRIRGKLLREPDKSGKVGARYYTLNGGYEIKRYAPIRDDVVEGATDGATVGTNVNDPNGDPYTPTELTSEVSIVRIFDFLPTDSSYLGFTIAGASTISAGGKGVILTNTGNDPRLSSPTGLNVNGAVFDIVIVRMRRTVQGDINVIEYPKLYYRRTGDSSFGETRVIKATRRFYNDKWDEFGFVFDGHPGGWSAATIDQIRFDPTQQGTGDSFELDWIKIGRIKGVTGTSDLNDDAGHGRTANWSEVADDNEFRPENNATRGAPYGSYVGTQLAEIVQGRAQSGYDLTQNNGTTLHSSSFSGLSLYHLDNSASGKLGGIQSGATFNNGALADKDKVDEDDIYQGAVTDIGEDEDSNGTAIMNSGAHEAFLADVSGVRGDPDGVKLFARVTLVNNLSTRDVAIQVREKYAGTSVGETIQKPSSTARTFAVSTKAGYFSGTKTYELVLRWFGTDQNISFSDPIIEWEATKK